MLLTSVCGILLDW